MSTQPEKEEKTRLQKFIARDSEYLIEFPEVMGYGYLLDYVSELGFVSSSGMGSTRLTYSEIKSWSELLDIKLSIFDVESIISLSTEYIIQKDLSKKKACPPPFVSDDEPVEERRKAVDSAFRNLAKNFNKNRKRKGESK